MDAPKRRPLRLCRVTSPTGLNLRSAADKDAEILAVMPCGAEPDLLSVGVARQKGWLRVKWRDAEGWCMAEYTEVTAVGNE